MRIYNPTKILSLRLTETISYWYYHKKIMEDWINHQTNRHIIKKKEKRMSEWAENRKGNSSSEYN